MSLLTVQPIRSSLTAPPLIQFCGILISLYTYITTGMTVNSTSKFKKAMIRNMVGSIPLTSWKKHTVTIAVFWGGSSLGFARTLGQHIESLRLVGPQSSKCAMTWDMNLVQCKEVMRNQHKMVDWDRCPNNSIQVHNEHLLCRWSFGVSVGVSKK